MLEISVIIKGDDQTEVVETANNQFISEGYAVKKISTDNGLAVIELEYEGEDLSEKEKE